MIDAAQYLVPVIRVTDLEESIGFFTKLGFACRGRYGDPPSFAVLYLGSDERHVIHLMKRDSVSADAFGLYVQVANVDGVYASAVAAGLEIVYPLADQPYGLRDFAVIGPDAIRVAIGQEIE